MEIELRSNRPELVAQMLSQYRGYAPIGDTPALVLDYHAEDPFRPERTTERPYPGFDCTASSEKSYEFWRRDARGSLELGPESAHARFRGLPNPWTVEAALRLSLSLVLPRLGGLLLHAAGVESAGKALVFSGPSGAGKTTLSRALVQDRAHTRLLGDEIIMIRPATEGWRAYATPFAGEMRPAEETSGVLQGLHFLVQSERNLRRAMGPADALSRVLRNMLAYVQEREAADRALHVASRFAAEVPCYSLEFRPGPEVAQVLGIA